jgi:hypothetical protein
MSLACACFDAKNLGLDKLRLGSVFWSRLLPLAEWLICFLVMDVQPMPEDLEAIAAQGILICLEDTIKGLQETSVCF